MDDDKFDKNAEIDKISVSAGRSPIGNALQNNSYGLNIFARNTIPIPSNRVSKGVTFYTRPMLNLDNVNLNADRRTSIYATDSQMTYQRMVRSLLDPVASKGDLKINSPELVDDNNPFITILSNYQLSMSGWPDLDFDTYTSSAGLYKEQWSMFDGTNRYHGTWDMNVTYKNVPGDPVGNLINLWTLYATGVYLGDMSPRMEAITEDYIDYQTAIYRMTLTLDQRIIQDIAKTIAFPTALTIGGRFNTDNDNHLSELADQIEVPWRCTGAEYNDPILMREFNVTVIMFNPEMADDKRDKSYVFVPLEYRTIFNHMMYPYINLHTSELQWWVRKDLFKASLPEIKDETIKAINDEAMSSNPKWLKEVM